MVTVSNTPQAPVDIGSTLSPLQMMMAFLINNWLVILLFIVVIILVAVAYALYKNAENTKLERDSPGFLLYRNAISNCDKNIKKEWVKKEYSLKNLLWLGIPIIWKEHSVKILDAYNNLIGYYRGHYKDQKGHLIYQVYKKHKLVFIEDTFLIRFPVKFNYSEPQLDSKGNVILDKKNKPKYNYKSIDVQNSLVKTRHNRDIILHCSGVEKAGMYYYSPVFFIGENENDIVDFRSQLEKSLIDESFRVEMNRILNISANNMRTAIKLNPHAKYYKETNEPVQENEEIERERNG